MSTTATTAPAKAALPNEGRPGYKPTKLGWIPEEWEVKTLGELGAIAMCKRIFKEETTANGEVPFFKIGTFGGEPDAFITRDKFEEYRRRFSFPKVGDILLSAAGTIGRTVVYDGRPAYFQDSNLVWIENNNEQVLNSYLYYLYPRIKWETDTSTIPRLYNESIRQTRILVPTLPEQRRIAAVLGAWDRAIATVQDLLAAQQERKRGVMQELLTGKRRFPGFGGKWVKRSIGEMIEESRIPVAQSNPERRITVRLHLGGVEQRQVRGTEATDAIGYFHRKAGQFIYGKQNLHKGAMGIVPKELNGYESTQDIPAFDFLPGTHPEFFLYLLSRPGWYPQLEKFATGTGSKRLHPEELYQVSVKVPDTIEEQIAIAKAIGTLDAEIEATQDQLDLLTTQKRGLMQQLLTGAVRVSVDQTIGLSNDQKMKTT